MRRHAIVVLIAVAVLSVFLGGWLMRRGLPAAPTYRNAALLEDVVQYVADNYVDSLSPPDLYRLAIDGLLEKLGDPYAALLDGEAYQDLQFTTTGDYVGVGMQVDVRNGWLTIIAPLPETPAETAGLRPGDRITGIDGVSTEGWDIDRAVRMLRGKRGTRVSLTLSRLGVSTPIEVSVERAEIHVRSVRLSQMLAPGVGYVQLSVVSRTSPDELAVAIDSLVREGMTGLVFDLRQNPGGLLDEGILAADLFLDSGQSIVRTQGRARERDRTYRDETPQRWPDLAMVTLVNEYTASAAEIVAGALQDHDRALVIGQITFGKGVVQTAYPMAVPNTALKFTTQRWFTPSGRSIQRGENDRPSQAVPDTVLTDAGRAIPSGGGITPDLIVEADTLTDAERVLFEQLGGNLRDYRDALTAYALTLVEQGVVAPDFQPSASMIRELAQRIRDRDVSLDPAAVAATEPLLRSQLAAEAIRFAHGPLAVSRLQLQRDRVVRRAVRLLQTASSPADLLKRAPAPE